MHRAVGVFVVPLVALFGLTAAVEAANAPTIKIPQLPGKIKLPGAPKTYPAKLHVAGGLTITSKVDTLANCAPGQAWTMSESVDLVINDRVTVQVISNDIASSTFARERKAVDQVSKLSSYRSSNYCPPTAPAELTKPNCTSVGGTGLANLTPDPRGNRLISIGITRNSGARQNLSCFGPAIDPTPSGTTLTALQAQYMGIVLPLKLKIKRLKKLKAGKSLISRVEIGGRCAFAVAAPDPLLSRSAADDDCEIEGFFNVQVKRVRK